MPLNLFVSLILLATPPAPAAAVPDTSPGQEALRAGRFDEAARRFGEMTQAYPAAPEGPFFEAFRLWWILLDEPAEEEALRLEMEDRLGEAALRADLLSGHAAEDARLRGLLFQGIALLLEAQSQASRGSHLAAASSARRGHRALSAALDASPGMPDALFAMGAYDYYADNLPLLVKGLRFFLFIPGGDERRGIARLEAAASGSRLFGTEASVLLAHIFSGAWEEDLSRALGYIDRAAARHPRSPLIALAQSRILRHAGRLRAAREAADRAEKEAGRQEVPAALSRLARYRSAEMTLALHHPLGALRRIEDALRRDPPPAGAETRKWMRVLLEASRAAGRPEVAASWIDRLPLPPEEAASLRRKAAASAADEVAGPRAAALARAADGDLTDARMQIEGLVSRHPDDPRLRYDLGRLIQIQGDLAGARPHLAIAAASDAPETAGWAKIRLGWDMEISGRRALAIPFYRDAAGMKRFPFREAARDRLLHPSTAQPDG